MVEEHVAETNRHAQTVKDRDASKMKPKSRAHKWKDTTVVEMLQFIGILLHMGIVRMPKIADYWRKTGETARLYMQDFYRGLMGRDRFQLVLRYWYYGEEDDPSGDQARATHQTSAHRACRSRRAQGAGRAASRWAPVPATVPRCAGPYPAWCTE